MASAYLFVCFVVIFYRINHMLTTPINEIAAFFYALRVLWGIFLSQARNAAVNSHINGLDGEDGKTINLNRLLICQPTNDN